MSVNERINQLVKEVFWAAKDVAKGNRALGKAPDYQKDWVYERKDLIARFHFRPAYLNKLQKMKRNVQMADFSHIMQWLLSLVKEEYRDEVRLLVLSLFEDKME